MRREGALRGEEEHDAPIDRIGDARLALLGEASHGTHAFYRERARITKRLVTEKGFTAVAVEADRPHAYRVNRYVRGVGDDLDAVETLADFRRFPTWMWRNTDVVELVERLRAYNGGLPPSATKTGLYGLDLYSLRTSMAAVLRCLEKVDPEAAARARVRYACFGQFGEDSRTDGLLAGSGLVRSCEDEVVSQLVDLRRRAMDDARRDGGPAEKEPTADPEPPRAMSSPSAFSSSDAVFQAPAFFSSWPTIECSTTTAVPLVRRRRRHVVSCCTID